MILIEMIANIGIQALSLFAFGIWFVCVRSAVPVYKVAILGQFIHKAP